MDAQAKDARPPLSDCKESANAQHQAFRRSGQSCLAYLQRAGQALIDCKSHLRSQAKCRWTLWLKENFEGSLESARGYMRIAQHWEDEAVVAARSDPTSPASMNLLLKIIREGTAPKRKPPELFRSPDEIATQWNRKVLMKDLRARLNSLTSAELEGLMQCGVDTCWQKFVEEAKRIRQLQQQAEWPPPEEPDHESIAGRERARERSKKRSRSRNVERCREYSI